MKKNVVSSSILKVTLFGLVAVFLTGCNWPNPAFGPTDSSGGSKSGDYSSDSYTYTDTPSPEGYPEKRSASCTYKDYINNQNFVLSCAPSVGSPKFLVVPIWFKDSNKFIKLDKREIVREDIRKAYFGTEEETGWESVKSYYYKDSFGHCNIEGFITDWYEIDDNYTKYKEYGTGEDATSALVESAVSWYKETYKVSDSAMKDFDYDGDGYLDGVLLIYGAPDYDSLGTSRNNLWAYCYWLQSSSNKNVNNPGPNAFFWASYDFMYNKTTALTRTGYSYGGGDSKYSYVDAHTYIHEMGHVFGLEDYYDYTETYSPAAGFSMQDCNVGAHDPYSRFALGWVKPYVPTETTTFTVKSMESSGECVLLSPEFTGSPFDEYMLIELYTPHGLNKFDSMYKYCYPRNYPQGPSVSGVRVWHIDARLWSNTMRRLTTNPRDGKVVHATSNTAQDRDYGTNKAGSYDYNILQLIRNGVMTTYKSNADLTQSDLFLTGSSYSQSTYKKQFVANSENLNSGKALGWTVSFDRVTDEEMTITVTKAN